MDSFQSNDAINLDNLDDWLENDLRESGLLSTGADHTIENKPTTPRELLLASPPISECTPRMDTVPTPMIKYEPLSPAETPKVEPKDDMSPTCGSIDLQPFIKALALLGSIQQNNTKSTMDKTINSNNKRERPDINNKNLSQEDLIALKRQRNTDAARRSRQRKAMKMEALEKRVLELETENERLRLRAAIAESEKANIEAKEKRSKVRILELERQLADAHRALLQTSYREITA
ncbi:hypothetical protein G6F70_000423 [Rhizopus microsporus]|uniref:BZIP domain-containing protein n=1 Tax=Rhizopus microsporus TaxID=58291 RepID=A0A0A1NVW7_RHIZD|nr:hypothetical protein G6F71_002561 [Rhizopus microsporus]KAG1204472.1 hypothetical protein G6F70_000423 [Rhizopus microsporus]KAG1215828.1 hypothetical protein G6F69_000639 [Rhizopus microsporus]KAG1236286.1 hypothetical protein G6F67_002109 [Rhizopus microsporus]KAG1268216.1 hypothetical protein G6F68_001291 [Rhizopus microsporus]